MQETIKLLVNGCGFSRGPSSWPYQLKGVDVTNLACSGAGNNYIHDTTVSELSKRKYDFVAVMWSKITRVDIKVNAIEQFRNSTNTSEYQSSKNDWPEKKIFPINDQDFVEKDWVFGQGFLNKNKDPVIVDSNIFNGIYNNKADHQFVYDLLIKMISLQAILKQLNIPYLFMFYQNYEHELFEYMNFYDMLDKTHIYNAENIYDIAIQKESFELDRYTPGATAQTTWAELIQPLIT